MIEAARSPVAALPSAVVLIGGGFSSNRPVPDAKLLAALPPANRILELGRPDSRVGTAYCQHHPQAQWLRTDPDAVTLEGIAGPFDLLVLSDGLPPPEVLV